MFKVERDRWREPSSPSALVLLAILTFLGVGCQEVSQTDSTPVVDTGAGTVRGVWAAEDEPRVAAFRGIPFASPPVGVRRFARPVATQWDGTLEANDSGPACWQPHTPKDTVYSRGEIERSEDCLRLNLWSTSGKLRGSDAGDDHELQPVMVWFHGGSHTTGSNGARIFDGANLARKGVVLVSANYRLGPLGFLAHAALGAEAAGPEGTVAAGNFGLWDKVAALEWVRDNVRSFGGDPANVTIFGQSAGSMSVCALMTAEPARGLFHRVIGQSAACLAPLTELRSADPAKATAESVGAEVVELLAGESSEEPAVDVLRSADPEAVLEARDRATRFSSNMVVDGLLLAEQPNAAFRRGGHHRVPVLVGSMADEETALMPLEEMTLQQLAERLRADYGDRTAALLDAYDDELSVEVAPGEIYRRVRRDTFFDHAARRWAGMVRAHGNDAFVYFFSRPTPAFLLYLHEDPPMALAGGSRSLGAFHSGDLAYVFNNLDLVGFDWDETDRRLADAISSYWVNFARTGNPNGEGLPEWPLYDPVGDEILEFGETIRTLKGWKAEKLMLMDPAPLEPSE